MTIYTYCSSCHNDELDLNLTNVIKSKDFNTAQLRVIKGSRRHVDYQQKLTQITQSQQKSRKLSYYCSR